MFKVGDRVKSIHDLSEHAIVTEVGRYTIRVKWCNDYSSMIKGWLKNNARWHWTHFKPLGPLEQIAEASE